MNNKKEFTLKNFLISCAKPYKWRFIVLFMTGAYWGINNAFAPYVLKLILDKVMSVGDNHLELMHAVLPYVLLYILLWGLIAVDMRFADWLRYRIFPAIRFDIVTKMFAYLEKHSYRYFQNSFSGSLSNKITDMHSGIINIFTIIDEGFAQCVGLVIAIVMLLKVHAIFALILLLWSSAFVLISVYYFKPIQNASNIFATSKTRLVGKIVDSISNINNVRLFAKHAHEDVLIQEATFDTISKDRDMDWLIIKMRIWWDISIVVLVTINLAVLLWMYRQNQVSIGDFSFVVSLSISVFYNLWYLASQFVNVAEELGKCEQALSIITAPLEIVDNPESYPLILTQGQIAFDNVSFHYGEGAHLFKDKSILIKGGEKVGLVGFSGSGKSSFVNLILRLFDLESGKITIDGQNIYDVTQDSLRENIAMIPQDISLFHRSLMENIRYGRVDASDEEVIEASQKAHCHEFIVQLREGYQSLVGERGIKLSGGQRQRIAIARAILKNAPILILDEATSALDSVTEKTIQEALHGLMVGRTTIVIAHRLSTLAEMDRILVFDKGRVIEEGTHEYLIQRDGHYARMWKMQVGGFLPSEL
jgi:ATP-binding cassette, subfamily B, bacterial